MREVLEGLTPAGPVTEAKSLAQPAFSMNRKMRRKAAAYSHSAAWRRLVKASERAAVKKLNTLAARRRTELAYQACPED